MSFSDTPHRRFNPLTGNWVLVSPHRAKRPWQGAQETVHDEVRPTYDSKCYLCPSNERVGGERNPAYEGPYVFDNDFAALLDGEFDVASSPVGNAADSLFVAEPVRGVCRVICFSPRHDLTLPLMSPAEIRRVVDVWADQTAELGERHRWVQVFENKGAAMGCSNPHPHGQIWASDFLPNEAKVEDTNQKRHFERTGSPMLLDYARRESEQKERTVVETDDWISVVPYWATWPFETLLLPKFTVRRLSELTAAQRNDLSLALKELVVRYDNLFQCSFPYSMGWHGAPFRNEPIDAQDGWHLHAHFFPPLLRSATVKKFMVGYEMLANVQRDITPEQAADALRATSPRHYTEEGA